VWAEGGLWSCVEDLARWIGFQLRAYASPAADSPVLAAASLREMHKARYLADDTWTTAWGVGWGSNRRDDVIWIQHSGGLPGFTSTVCFDPRTEVGAIVLVNGTSGSVQLGVDLASIARTVVLAAPPAIEAPQPAPGHYLPLLGIYARPGLGGWMLRLEWRDGNLTITTPDAAAWYLTLAPTADPDVFAVEQASSFAGHNVTFQRLAAGRISSMHLMDSTFVRLDPVVAPG
jgi:hypothetical protein